MAETKLPYFPVSNFQEIVTSLPSIEPSPLLLTNVLDLPPIRHLIEPNAQFVPPTFREDIAFIPGLTSVILLTAPAAVGKSTVAAEIARRTGAPLFDLSHFQVGDGFIEGIISKAYGRQAAASILDDVERGAMTLVFDALDEGEIRAGGNNFDAFMLDLCALCATPRPKPTIVVLARGETATLVKFYFDEKEVNYASYVVDFFDKEDAREFLNLRLDEINRRARPAHRAGHRQNRDKFNEAVDLLFSALSKALAPDSQAESWEDPRIKTFLGYAPVLTALAEYLRVRNYSNLSRDLSTSPPWLAASHSAWQLLGSIVQSLIIREQGKVIDNARPRMQAGVDSLGFDNWDSLFATDEQVIRVLARALRISIPDHLPVGIPGQLRDPYEDAVDVMLPQHPFLSDSGFASVVFEEFLYSWTLQRGPAWLRQDVRQRLRQPAYLPSPLLAYFMLESNIAQDSPTIHAEDIGVFINSLQSRVTRPGEVQIAIGETEGSELEGYVSITESDEYSVRFAIDELAAGILLWRRASYCFINAPDIVRLASDKEFRLGPEAYIECTIIEINASEMRVDTGNAVDGSGAVLIAGSYSDLGLAPRIRTFGRAEFLISWPSPAYPWVDYRAVFEMPEESDKLVAEVYQHLRRILRGFRGSAAFGGIGRSVQYIDSVAVGQSKVANSLRDYLVETGLLSKGGSRYVLDTAKAADLGLSFTNLRTNTLLQLTRPYLEAFARRYEEGLR